MVNLGIVSPCCTFLSRVWLLMWPEGYLQQEKYWALLAVLCCWELLRGTFIQVYTVFIIGEAAGFDGIMPAATHLVASTSTTLVKRRWQALILLTTSNHGNYFCSVLLSTFFDCFCCSILSNNCRGLSINETRPHQRK